MLVEVIELYWHGEKLSRDARRQLSPVRGELSVDRLWTHSGIEDAPVHAHLVPPRLEPLYRVKLRYWRGRNVVLSGQQRAALPGRRAEAPFEQWWWCKIITDPLQPAAGRS